MNRKILAVLMSLGLVLAFAMPLHHVGASANVARIVAHDSVVGQTADVATISSVTVPSGGADYRVSLVGVMTAGVANAGQMHVDYTDDVGSQVVVIAIDGGSPGTFAIHAASGTVVVSSFCTQNACAGSGAHTYNVYATIEEL
jgi:hypothetical protein